MELRNRRGGITPAEGCMFTAVALFVILLIGILYIAFMRFGNPPPPTPVPPPAAMGQSAAPDYLPFSRAGADAAAPEGSLRTIV